MPETPTSAPPPVMDDPNAPVHYATELLGASTHQGGVTLTFACLKRETVTSW